jgi:hypothetical protein
MARRRSCISPPGFATLAVACVYAMRFYQALGLQPEVRSRSVIGSSCWPPEASLACTTQRSLLTARAVKDWR